MRVCGWRADDLEAGFNLDMTSWVLVKGLNYSYCSKETILFT